MISRLCPKVLNTCSKYRCLAVSIPFNPRYLSISSQSFNSKNSLSKHVRADAPTLGEKAKEATKTTYYTLVICVGVGAFCLMMYAVFRELLSSFSPQAVYSAAVEKVCENTRVQDCMGDNIKSFGETSRRGRRTHISHFPYEVNGQKGFRIKFYVKGQRASGTAHLDARETSYGWEYRYLFVQLDTYPHEVIIVEDNRQEVEKDNIMQSLHTA